MRDARYYRRTMRLNMNPWLDRYPWLKRSQEVAIFAQRRARDVKMAQVAGSLTFTTMLTIVPLFAVALALFTASPLFVEFRGAIENAVLKALPGQISETVLGYINEFALKATRLTAVGLIFLTGTAVAMMVTFDRVLNDIWRVRNRRPLTQRILIYWAILTLGPLLVGASLTATSYLWTLSGDAVKQLPPALRGVLDFAPVIISGFAYAALYVFVPNRSVAWRDALVGGFIAAALAELLKHAFGDFVSRGTTGPVYGAFAVLPLFLIWIYLSWYVLLFGAAITATLPRLRTTRFSDEMRAGDQFVTSVALLKVLMLAKGSKAPALKAVELARQIKTSIDETERLLETLERLGYVRKVAVTHARRRTEHEWVLLCDENQMTLKPAYEHLVLDPTNTLINGDDLGMRAMRTRWFQPEWLRTPLVKELSNPHGDKPLAQP